MVGLGEAFMGLSQFQQPTQAGAGAVAPGKQAEGRDAFKAWIASGSDRACAGGWFAG